MLIEDDSLHKILTEDSLLQTLHRSFLQKSAADQKVGGGDPCQTFTVGQMTGVFLTGVDIFFQSKDETLPVILEMRTTDTGLPTQKISVTLQDLDEINLSEDGSVPTRFTFSSPVYLNGETEYVVLGVMLPHTMHGS